MSSENIKSNGTEILVSETVLNKFFKIMDTIKSKEDDYLLALERLLYLIFDTKKKKNELKVDFNIDDLVDDFVDKINRRSVDAFNEKKLQIAEKEISRIIDFLHNENINLIYENKDKLDEARVLSYNNLSCIYRKVGNLSMALQVSNMTLKTESELAKKNFGLASVSIISTFLNKCAILSELGKHTEAIDAAKEGQLYLKNALQKPTLHQKDKEHLRYLEMLSYYNLGAEHEHLNQRSKAVECFERSLIIANDLNNKEFKLKLVDTIKSLKK